MERSDVRIEIQSQIREINSLLPRLVALREISYTDPAAKPAGRQLSLAITELESTRHWLRDAETAIS